MTPNRIYLQLYSFMEEIKLPEWMTKKIFTEVEFVRLIVNITLHIP